MVDPQTFYNALVKSGVEFFTGVPDSLLSSLCACIAEHAPEDKHIITANEGAAIALATGNYLATAKPSLVYMQNSGLGNAINPLLSLADPSVYAIPMLLMIGWRGEPRVKDEPQHLTQGKVTVPLLEAMGIAYHRLPQDTEEAVALIEELAERALSEQRPVAILASKNSFAQYKADQNSGDERLPLTRERAIGIILENINADTSVISSTGMISRELYELREGLQQKHDTDFLTVGSMGHCSQIALGVALSNKNKKVICLDGDGAAIMHMGSMAVTAQSGAANLIHIILNNGRHDSVGGQPTCGFEVDFTTIAKGCGYPSAHSVDNEAELSKVLEASMDNQGPVLLEVRVSSGNRDNLGRPEITLEEQKRAFMRHLEE